jgi:hypothetical protein
LKILLVQPEDSPSAGPWASEKWDLIVDFGKSSAFTRASWQQRLNVPILQLDSLRRANEDIALIRQMLGAGRKQIIDAGGLDWWDLISILVSKEMGEAVLLRRLVAQLDSTAELYTTRQGWPVSGVALLLGRHLLTFPTASRSSGFQHYSDLLRRFSFGQLAEIFLDKYDPCYRWRTQFARKERGRKGPVVLLPSAYTNVSRMALAYASMLPEQSFLLVATRRSGTQFDSVPNVTCTSLAAYAGGPESQKEYSELLSGWKELQRSLASLPEMDLLMRAGRLEKFPDHFRGGLAVRNAWQNVFSREQVVTVMCGDDSNPYTRLPVLLARSHGIPTLDFHHGALDGRFLTKELSSDLYLAKGEMERDYLVRICGMPAERVVIAGPYRSLAVRNSNPGGEERSQIIFFSEPYENGGWRAEEIYRELLPPLAKLAHGSGRKLVVKLHPFESRSQRAALIDKILAAEDARRVDVVEGPFTPQLIAKAWFAITVESTTVIDCSLQGVACFVCEWLSSSPYGYTHQYARFGVGRVLSSPEQLEDLARIVAEPATSLSEDCLVKPMDPQWLRRIITGGDGGQKTSSPETLRRPVPE